MRQERLTKSVLVQYFQAFHDELIVLKHQALNEGLVEKKESEKEEEESPAPDREIDIEEKEIESFRGKSLSVAEKILYRLEKFLNGQYKLMEMEGGEYVARYYDEARYVMTALADEVFLNLDWNGKKEWQDNLLESKIYKTQDAGEKFFSKLDAFLKTRDMASFDLAVVYLMALGLGFQGQYRGQNASNVLNKYKQKLYDMITYDTADKKESSLLFEEAYHHTLNQRDASSIINIYPWYIALGGSILLFLLASYCVWLVEVRNIFGIVKEFYIWIKSNVIQFD